MPITAIEWPLAQKVDGKSKSSGGITTFWRSLKHRRTYLFTTMEKLSGQKKLLSESIFDDISSEFSCGPKFDQSKQAVQGNAGKNKPVVRREHKTSIQGQNAWTAT